MRDEDDVHGQYLADPGDPGPKVGWEVDEGWLWVSYDDDVGWAEHAARAGAWLPLHYSVQAEWRTLPYVVVLDFAVEEGRPRCTGLALGAERVARALTPGGGQLVHRERAELTSTGLRAIPVGDLVRLGELAAVHGAPGPDGARPAPPSLDEWSSAYASDEVPARQRGERLDDEHYRRVA